MPDSAPQQISKVFYLSISPPVCFVVCDLARHRTLTLIQTNNQTKTEADVSHEEALLILKVALPHTEDTTLAGAQSARQLYEIERTLSKIITFSSEIDAILGGGVPLGQITEFCGAPGVGKTQMGMQLAINVQLPEAFNGAGGEAIYIDTEGSFMPERCKQMAAALCTHLRKIAAHRQDPRRIAAAESFTVDSLLSRIHVCRARDSTEQLAIVDYLPQFLDAHREVRLIVVDSVTFHFRQDYADMPNRTRVLSQMAQSLMELAGNRQIAVVLMNQVTTKFLPSTGSGASTSSFSSSSRGAVARLVPALGDSWAHAATNRVILYWQESVRHAFIFKSPTQPAAAAKYTVTGDGVRSIKPSSILSTKRPLHS